MATVTDPKHPKYDAQVRAGIIKDPKCMQELTLADLEASKPKAAAKAEAKPAEVKPSA